jgi:hypothetical protein
MSFKYLSFVSLFILFFTVSCSEEIEMSKDDKQTAIVYGILDQNDEIHYIKINRAFVGPGNANDIAKIPDSSYFEKIDATIQEVKNGTVTRTWELRDTLIENKEPGIFYYPTQKVYYFKTLPSSPLLAESGVVYKLDINVNDGQFNVSGETQLISGINITSPQAIHAMSFHKGAGEFTSTTISYNKGTSEMLEVKLLISIAEFRGSEVTNKIIDWNIAKIESATSNVNNSTANGSAFYDVISKNVTNDPNITKRCLNSIEIQVTGATSDLQSYISVNKPSSSLAQNKPTFTNLKTTNNMRIIGVFTAKNTFSRLKAEYQNPGTIRAIDRASVRELCNGSITGQLLFCSRNPSDSNDPGIPKIPYCPN